MREAALMLCFRERGRDFFKGGKMLADVGLGVLHGNGPLLVPPIRLSEHAAIDHAEPIVPPEIDVNPGPIAIVANFLRIQHQRAVDAGDGDVRLKAGFLDDGAIPLDRKSTRLNSSHGYISYAVF